MGLQPLSLKPISAIRMAMQAGFLFLENSGDLRSCLSFLQDPLVFVFVWVALHGVPPGFIIVRVTGGTIKPTTRHPAALRQQLNAATSTSTSWCVVASFREKNKLLI
jgi:hypothetical protein